MESIRIKNFRSLQDTGNIELKPITVAVGKNSAGKSTFLRTFPLFKQSVEERIKTPILLYSRNGVDFGSYKDVKSIFAKDEEFLEFDFLFKDVILDRKFRRLGSRKGSVSTDLNISMKIDSDVIDVPKLKVLELSFFDNIVEIHFEMSKNNLIHKITINEKEIKFEHKLSFFNRGLIIDRLIFKDNKKEFRYDLEDYSQNEMFRLIEEKVRKGTSAEKINLILKQVSTLNTKEEFLLKMKSLKKPTTWATKIDKLNDKSDYLNEFYELVILNHLEEVLSITNNYMRETFHRVKYIAPIRATAERYYRIQDLSVDEVDAHGQNLPMFLGSLSSRMLERFQAWTEEHFSFKVKIKPIEGHYSIKILYSNGFEVNISDMGFGYSQILPIITQIWYSTVQAGRMINPRMRDIPTIFVIEQPELHLHPEFQAKFADVIIKVINDIKERNINIKFIIETHSQTLINRFGANISKKIISKNDINIIIFNKENEGEATRIQSASFDDEGLLENWPIGFFKPASL